MTTHLIIGIILIIITLGYIWAFGFLIGSKRRDEKEKKMMED
jgi:hypothetical protein